MPVLIQWKLNPLVFDGDSTKFCSLSKEATIFLVYCGFSDVLGGTQIIPIANQDLSYTQIRAFFTDEEIEGHKNAYQFLRSALNSEMDGGILLRACCPTEAWRNLEV